MLTCSGPVCNTFKDFPVRFVLCIERLCISLTDFSYVPYNNDGFCITLIIRKRHLIQELKKKSSDSKFCQQNTCGKFKSYHKVLTENIVNNGMIAPLHLEVNKLFEARNSTVSVVPRVYSSSQAFCGYIPVMATLKFTYFLN